MWFAKPSGDDLLAVYLRDQLALGLVWRQLAYRAARNNRNNPSRTDLMVVARAVADDVETFRSIMKRLGIPESRAKSTLAICAERIGRIKLNGRVVRFSPLSRFFELDALTMGIQGKKQLWRTLADLAGLRTRLPDVDFDGLVHSAESQRIALEPVRIAAAGAAFGTSHAPRFQPTTA